MKYIYILLFYAFSLFSFELSGQCKCDADIGNAMFMKEFNVKLDFGKPAPNEEITLLLNKGTRYRFATCDASNSKGEIIFTLYDQERKILTTFDTNTEKKYPTLDFICKKTAVYRLIFSFRDGKAGCGKLVLSLVNKP